MICHAHLSRCTKCLSITETMCWGWVNTAIIVIAAQQAAKYFEKSFQGLLFGLILYLHLDYINFCWDFQSHKCLKCLSKFIAYLILSFSGTEVVDLWILTLFAFLLFMDVGTCLYFFIVLPAILPLLSMPWKVKPLISIFRLHSAWLPLSPKVFMKS